MLIWTTLKISLASLTGNKLRSILTMLGVIIGVGAVIAMLSLGNAFGVFISNQVTWLGSNVLYVRPGQFSRGPMNLVQTLKAEDAEAILGIKGVKAVSPMVMNSGPVKAGNKASNTAGIMGVAPSIAKIQNIQIERGSWFTDDDVRRSGRVAILGSKTAADLFGDIDPIDRVIRIQSVSFRVVGVTKAIGDQGGFNPDDRVLIPYTTCMKQIPPRREFVQTIVIEAFDKDSLDGISKDATQLLRRRHHLRPEAPDDFFIQNMAQILATLSAISMGLTLFLGTVAAISLLVGGIGIMNIMLATVAERTREIGIRKAIGAKDRDIMRQFLIEALVLTLSGGLIGLALGWLLKTIVGMIVQQWLKLYPEMQWWVVILSIAISTTVGLVSGLYPAYRASRLNPVEALRYE